MDGSEPRALSDRDDRFLDDAYGEERLALTRAPERDDGASALEVPRCGVRDLVGCRPERGGFSRRCVGIVVEDSTSGGRSFRGAAMGRAQS